MANTFSNDKPTNKVKLAQLCCATMRSNRLMKGRKLYFLLSECKM